MSGQKHAKHTHTCASHQLGRTDTHTQHTHTTHTHTHTQHNPHTTLSRSLSLFLTHTLLTNLSLSKFMFAPLAIATRHSSESLFSAAYFLAPAIASAPEGSVMERVSSKMSLMAVQISSVSCMCVYVCVRICSGLCLLLMCLCPLCAKSVYNAIFARCESMHPWCLACARVCLF